MRFASAVLIAVLASGAALGATQRGQPAQPVHLGHPGLYKLLMPAPVLSHPWFDMAGFKARFENDMKASGATNYIVEFRQNGQTILLDKSGYAVEPQDGAVPWAANVPMHVASVSKLITAMAMVKLLDSPAVNAVNPTPYKSPIVNALPSYWVIGTKVGQVSFRDLLQHRTGWSTTDDEEDNPGYPTMMAVIAGGTRHDGVYRYENVNYTLMRVLLAVVNGDADRTAMAGDDAKWDQVSISAYNTYVQNKVFAPAGVNGAVLSHTPGMALAYSSDLSGHGWNSGDLQEDAGCAGWHLNIDQLLDVMGTYVRGGGIVTPPEALATLMLGYGIDDPENSGFGPLYAKGGDDFDSTGRIEQAAAMFVPNANIEAAAFVNMPVDKGVEHVLVQDFIASVKQSTPFGTQGQ